MTSLAVTLGVLVVALTVTSAILARSRAALARSLEDARARAAGAESARALAEARLADVNQNESRLRDLVDSLAAEALRANSEEFLKLAKATFQTEQKDAQGALEQRKQAVENLVKPLHEKLQKTGDVLRRLEEERIKEYGALRQFTTSVQETSDALGVQTSRLVKALRKPQVRGRYGEIQLQRVVELAGMRDYCDFDTQATTTADDGARLRPDMVVHLPNDRVIVIDAKTNIDAYLDAIESDDPDQAERDLDRFARRVLDQARALAKKDYAGVVGSAPDFVVMFIPGDQFIDAALQRQPKLLDFAAEDGVILASPSTLIGLLRAVHVGWREKKLSDNAEKLFELGRELHDRAANVLTNISKVGESIEASRTRFNTLVGSVDGRLMPTIRKFEDQGARSSKDALTPLPLDGETRELRSPPARVPAAEPGDAVVREPTGASAPAPTPTD